MERINEKDPPKFTQMQERQSFTKACIYARFTKGKILESKIIGINYFGLNNYKRSKKNRTAKGVPNCYGVLFTYPTTRTIHIELREELSTDDVLLALRRFISRRGTVKSIRSYNGTNFAKAKNKMKTCLNQLDQVKIKKIYVVKT